MPDYEVKQSTTGSLVAGPFRDVTNPATKLTSLTITKSDVILSKNGGNMNAKNETSNATHLGDGYYAIPFNATDYGTKGNVLVEIAMAGAFPVDFTFAVLDGDEWDRKYGTGTSVSDVNTNLQKMLGYPIHTDTVDTAVSNNRFIMNTGSSINDIYNGMLCVLIDAGNSANILSGIISDYDGTQNEVFLFTEYEPFSLASGDIVRIYYPTAANMSRWLDELPLALDTSLVQTQANQLDTQAKTDVNTEVTTVVAAMRGADSDTLKSLSDQIDGITTSQTPILLQNTTIATLASQTSFTLSAGSADDDAYNNTMLIITDQATSTQKAFSRIIDYTGSTKTVTLAAAPAFTIAVGDTVDIVASSVDTDLVSTINTNTASTKTTVEALNNVSTSDITTAILAMTVESGLTFKHAIQGMFSATAAKAALSGTTYTLRDYADTKNRITASVDANGQRTSVTYSFD